MENKPFYSKIRKLSDDIYWVWKNNLIGFSKYKPDWNKKIVMLLEFLDELTPEDLLDFKTELIACRDKVREHGALIREGDIWTARNVPRIKGSPIWYYDDCIIKLLVIKKILIVSQTESTNMEGQRHRVFTSNVKAVEVKLFQMP